MIFVGKSYFLFKKGEVTVKKRDAIEVVVLEGRDRVGGRILTHPIGDSSVDLGIVLRLYIPSTLMFFSFPMEYNLKATFIFRKHRWNEHSLTLLLDRCFLYPWMRFMESDSACGRAEGCASEP